MNRRGAIKLAILALLVAGMAALYFSPARTYLTKEHLHDLIAFDLAGVGYIDQHAGFASQVDLFLYQAGLAELTLPLPAASCPG